MKTSKDKSKLSAKLIEVKSAVEHPHKDLGTKPLVKRQTAPMHKPQYK